MIGYASAQRRMESVHRGGSMVMLSEQETQLKQIYFEEGSITRVSLEWQDMEYDIASKNAPNDSSSLGLIFSVIAQWLTKHTIAGGDSGIASQM